MSKTHEYRQEIGLHGVDGELIEVLVTANATTLDLVALEQRHRKKIAHVSVIGFERVDGRDIGRRIVRTGE